MAAQIILSLSILVGIHEAGHMFFAKLFGMRVEQFSIGFPPKIFKIKKGETEYSIGAVPLGGFVKISGMVDESLDTEKLKEEPKPWEFRSKPAWQRLIVMIGGIAMNVIIGIAIFIILLYSYGEPYIPKENVNRHGIYAFELAENVGLRTGDKILDINGRDYEEFSELLGIDVLLERGSYYTVERNGQIIRVDLPPDLIERFSEKENRGRFIAPRSFTEVDGFTESSPAQEAGLQKGDVIVEIDGDTIYFQDLPAAIKEKADQTVALGIQRGGELTTIEVKVASNGMIGIRMNPHQLYDYRRYTFAESVANGAEKAFVAVYSNAKALGMVITGKLDARKSLSGPIGIAQVFGGTWDWQNFWYLTGLISMILAFMNLLPIPALDGGHVVFLMYEIISGRKPSDKFMENAQKVGMLVLLTLMAFVIFNDIWKLF